MESLPNNNMVDGEQVVRSLTQIVDPPHVDIAYLQRMVTPVLEDPAISQYLKKCGEGLAEMVKDEEPLKATELYDLGMRKIALMVGMFYGREQQKEISRLGED